MTKILKFCATGENRFPQAVVGESRYQDHLRAIVGYISPHKYYKKDNFQAYLYLEDRNPYDPGNAVRIDINKLVVGYLSSEDAKRYRKSLTKFTKNDPDCIGLCNAAIYGKKAQGEKEFIFGVWLDLNIEDIQLDIPEKPKPSIWQRIKKVS